MRVRSSSQLLALTPSLTSTTMSSAPRRRAQFRPCIDLHNGTVKQIVGGTLSALPEELRTNWQSQQPASFYGALYRRHALTGGHVIKLGPGNDAAAAEALQAWPGALHVGGGITCDNALEWLDKGAEKVRSSLSLNYGRGGAGLPSAVAEHGDGVHVLDADGAAHLNIV
jgi:phosphoribosylformimino-5-aminoimidazole carboxamide ribonucleotide (ProFAR) isomerase